MELVPTKYFVIVWFGSCLAWLWWLLLCLFVEMSLASRGMPHIVRTGQGYGSILASAIIRALHPNCRISSLMRQVIDDTYKQHKDNSQQRRFRGFLLFQVLGFTDHEFEQSKMGGGLIKKFEEDYIKTNEGVLDYKDLEFSNEDSLREFIAVLQKAQDCLVICRDKCLSTLKLMTELNKDFKITIGNGIMKRLVPVKFDNDNRVWFNSKDPSKIIEQTADWDDNSVIYSNDYDKLSKNLDNSKESQASGVQNCDNINNNQNDDIAVSTVSVAE